jgi:hypothetical protein
MRTYLENQPSIRAKQVMFFAVPICRGQAEQPRTVCARPPRVSVVFYVPPREIKRLNIARLCFNIMDSDPLGVLPVELPEAPSVDIADVWAEGGRYSLF